MRSPRVMSSSIRFLSLAGALILVSCGGDGGPSSPRDPNPQPDPSYIALSVDGAPEVVHTEASGMPVINCDPRVDWYLYQILLYEHYTGGAGPNGYDFFFGMLSAFQDSVGTYTVHGTDLEGHFNNGTRYMAGPNIPTSDGTLIVTRSDDDRIEGTFSFTAADLQQWSSTITLSGHFSVASGYSTTCP